MNKHKLIRYNNSLGQDVEVDYDFNPTDLYLHISDSDWYQTLHSIKQSPFQARIWVVRAEHRFKQNQSLCKFLPLHSACAREPPLAVVTALLEAYPEGAARQDDKGMLPLHYATANHASSEVVQTLIRYNPDALFQRIEPSGSLPIHLAAHWGVSSLSVMKYLLENNNSLASARDAEGLSPLEIAIDAGYREHKAGIINLLKDATLQENLERSSTLTSTKSYEFKHEVEIISPTDSNSNNRSKSGITSMDSQILKERADTLKKAIKKLQSGKGYIKSSAEEQIALEWEAVHMAIGELNKTIYEQRQDKTHSADTRDKLSIRDGANDIDSSTVHEVDAIFDIKQIRDENIQLEEELKKLNKVYRRYRAKVRTVELIIEKLADTIMSVSKNQSARISRLKKRDNEMKSINKLRAQKLTELAKEVDAAASTLSAFAFTNDEQKAFEDMKKEQDVLAKMSEIIQALKS